MVSSLAQYVARSPRYILQPHDNTLIRVAGPSQIPWEEGTEIHNVSLSGLAFTAPSDLTPMIGETIKIQFDTHGSGSMACLALVIRLDKVSKSTMRVAVKFMKLEMPQRLALAQALAQKLKEQGDLSEASDQVLWWEGRKARIVMAMTALALWVALLHFFWFKSL